MSRYAHGSSLHSYIFFFFFFFFFIPFVFSQLLPNQQTTMTQLAKFVNSHSKNSPWKNARDPNPCSWKGVTCTSTFITHLSLSGFGLNSSDFLPEVCQIDTLESLDLSKNFLTSIPDGFISNCGEINGLKSLNMSNSNLDGSLPSFIGFAKLESLDLSMNSLSGSIDLLLDGLVGIKNLNLSGNGLSGSIPSKLGRSLVLEELQLSKNNFSGKIPDELFSCRNLTLIDLSANSISGSVSNAIGELSKLEILLLSANNFTGQIPDSLSDITTLSRISANQNQFTGTIPRGISQYVKNLDLSYNGLIGSIPNDFLSSQNLESVDLSFNSLEGVIPSDVSSSMFRLRLGSNSLNGTVPPVGTLSTKLTYLELDNNSLSGEIPKELGSLKNLALLNLASNNLTGPLPKELGDLSHLQVMKLQCNKLIGELPVQFSQLANLSQMNISNNDLIGSIPSDFSRLEKLTNLNLRDNHLNGSIPVEIGNLDLLLELQLGKNLLSGRIPRMPPRLQIALNLSNNLFTGPIPDSLGILQALEVLDLSNNEFTGEVPGFLAGMSSLTRLLLSNNQLSGILPSFKEFVIVDTAGNNVVNASTLNKKDASPKKGYSVVLAIVVAIVAAVVGVAIVGVIVLLVTRRLYRVNVESLNESGEHPSPPQVINGHLITANSIHKSAINFTTAMKEVTNPANIMLKTRFSTYYKAVMPGGANYYVKKLNWVDKIFQLGSHEKFGQEIEFLGRLSNSNVMIPLAYVLTIDSAYVFYEYGEKGTLFDAIHGSGSNTLDWASRYSIAVGVAQGLAFLHGCINGPVLLLDLSTRSILLKSLKEPKIGDIELCKVIDPSKSTGSISTIAGSVGYIPPEYAYTMRVTMAGNVYSFGVILLELLTGKPAVSEGTELAKWALSNSIQRNSWNRILDPSVSKTSVRVQTQMLSVLKIALSCVSVSPEARPDTRTVLRMLSNSR